RNNGTAAKNGRRSGLSFLQANVAKKPGAHDTLLNLGWERAADIILVQEPWTAVKEGRRLTKTHGGYQHYTPVEEWMAGPPRTMVYVRKPRGGTQRIIGREGHRDICAVEVCGTVWVSLYR
ncbi:hypothetical protein QBC36DRAFT_145343, partial [Triangularia setosa]